MVQHQTMSPLETGYTCAVGTGRQSKGGLQWGGVHIRTLALRPSDLAGATAACGGDSGLRAGRLAAVIDGSETSQNPPKSVPSRVLRSTFCCSSLMENQTPLRGLMPMNLSSRVPSGGPALRDSEDSAVAPLQRRADCQRHRQIVFHSY